MVREGKAVVYGLFPATDEAWRMLLQARHSVRKTRHCLAVALGALRLGLALEQNGHSCFPGCHVAGGLLHDIAHSQGDDAREGARLMTRLGWPGAACVVGSHNVLPVPLLRFLGLPESGYGFRPPVFCPAPEQALEPIRAAAMSVYLADKYSYGDRAVSISERFDNIRAFCRAPREGIDKRQMLSKAVEDWFSRACSASPLDIVLTPTTHHLEETLRSYVLSFAHILDHEPGYVPRASSRYAV